jgi:acetate kinase
MSDNLLVLNAGSSSLKFSVFRAGERPEVLVRGQVEGLMTEPQFTARDAAGRMLGERSWPTGTSLGHAGAIEFLFDWGGRGAFQGRRVIAAGHRLVHGGLKFDRPVRVDAATLAELESLVPLAPLHQPHNLAPIRAVAELAPRLPQVACFDTAFHRTQPAVAQSFALPRRLTDSGVRRYGFHGLSYEYIASVLGEFDAGSATGRSIVAHLGNGASMCAMRAGRSIATTMGFTPVDGLPMGTRSGAIDPGVLVHLMDRYGMDARAIERLIYHESGLLGVSGISSDMRLLLERAASEPGAAEAIDLFVYRIGRELGSLAASLGGLECVIFTGGIGENAVSIRARVCRDAAWLGLELDEPANVRGGPLISMPGSKVAAWVIPTNEELMIARHVLHLLSLGDK